MPFVRVPVYYVGSETVARVLTTPEVIALRAEGKRVVAGQEIRYPLPTLADLAETIYDTWATHWFEADDATTRGELPAFEGDGFSDDAPDTCVDIRLQTFGSDRSAFDYRYCWTFTTGDSSYDQAHGDFCASSSFDATEKPTKKAARAVARELLAEIRDNIGGAE